MVEDEADLGVVEVVLQPPEDGEAGDEDGVAEVALLGVLAQLDEAVDAVEPDDLHADLGVVAQPGNGEKRSWRYLTLFNYSLKNRYFMYAM